MIVPLHTTLRQSTLMTNDHHELNTDLCLRIAVNTQAMDWTESAGGHVLRKRVHLSGPAESGQVTSIVRYMAGAHFPAHDHPQGEEILVLDGVFSDEHGDWPAGTYLLNPEGFRHSPFSRTGCTLWVKLRQYPGADRRHLAVHSNDLTWATTDDGRVARKLLYSQQPYPDHTRLERWDSPSTRGELAFAKGAEVFVLDGGFEDEFGRHPRHSWLRIPAGGSVKPTGGESCEVYIKEGGFAYLR